VRLVPGSLLWRTLLVVVLAMVLSQATAMWLWQEYVTRPRGEAAIGQFVLHLKTVHAALQAMGPAQQDRFIERVAEQEGIRIRPVRGAEAMRPAPDRAVMRLFRERLREQFGTEAEVFVREGEGRFRLTRVVLAAESDGKVQLLVSVTKDLTDRVKAGQLVKELAPIVGGGGGGRPDFAEAGGRDAARIDEMLARARELVQSALQS
jgi:hypothetical protein